MGNPFLERVAKAGKSAHGKRSEARVAKSLGARLTPASGALDSAKGDFKLSTILGEAKSTINASISIEYDWLLKIAHEALYQGKTPALTVSFVNGNGTVKHNGDWVLIPLPLLHTLQES
jgi:hypothetical protein